MKKGDWRAIFIIGAGVGLLVQPILSNNISNFHLTLLMRLGIFLFFFLFAPLALYIAKLLSRFAPGFYQFAQFAAVGTLNSFIDVGVFNLETFLFGTSLISNGLFALFKAISFVFATTNSFVWNKYWTFGAQEKPKAKEVTGFYAVALVGWVVNVGVATLVKSVGPVSHLWVNIAAPLSGIAASFLLNFFCYKYIVFKKKVPASV